MSKHTPEHTINPFELGEWDEDGSFGYGSVYIWAGNQEKLIAEVFADDVPECEAKENARRLVAAWNACDGISTEALEGGAVCKLLAACKAAVELYGKPGGPWNVPSDPGSWLAQARAAIALAEGAEGNTSADAS